MSGSGWSPSRRKLCTEVAIGGMATAITASTPGSPSAACSAIRKLSPVAAVVRSTGVRGRRPTLRQESWVSRPSESELPTTATRSPAGSGCSASSSPVSKSSVMVSTRTTPACWKSASTVTSRSPEAVGGTAWPGGRLPVCRAPLTTTIGLAWASRRAIRVNLRGLPKDSR